jgi:phage terminase large subunit GpA-like protein
MGGEHDQAAESEVSATPGNLKLSAYQRGFLDVLDEPEVTDVTVVKAARIGFSTALIAALGNYVQRDPSP